MSLSQKSKISLLKKLDFMADQKEEVFQFLADQVEEITVYKDQTIFIKGDKGGAAYIIAKGCIQIHYKEHVFVELEEGKSFGEFALIETDTRSASATTKQDSLLLVCTEAHLRLVEQKFQVDIIDTIQTALQNMKQRMLVKDLLEEELTRQKIQIEEQKKELETLNATKDKFFSIIAHDLKNPFASLIGASDFLVSSSNDLSKEQMANFLNIINNSAKQGYRLLENLLEWSRMQTGILAWQPEQVDMWDLVNEVVHLLRGSAETKQIHLEARVDEDLSAFVDPNMINTVVRNLVSNAIKFTPRGGEVIVESKQLKDAIEITVRDNGIGIKAADIAKLFRIDEQLMQNGTENETGTGLGLILCKEFIDKHKGELYVKSELNKGSSFIFTLPIS